MALKFIRRVSSGFSGGLLPVLPVSRQKRPESLSGGARNGCYGKSGQLSLGGLRFFWESPCILYTSFV